jgi:hypothetical protein
MKVRNLVIGDIHGCVNSLDLLLEKIDAKGVKYDRVIQVGDFGYFGVANTSDLLDYTYHGLGADKEFLWVDGNHEDHKKLNDNMSVLKEHYGYCPRGTRLGNMLLVGGASSIPMDKYNRIANLVFYSAKINKEKGRASELNKFNMASALLDWYKEESRGPLKYTLDKQDEVENWLSGMLWSLFDLYKIAYTSTFCSTPYDEAPREMQDYRLYSRRLEELCVGISDEDFFNVRSYIPNLFYQMVLRMFTIDDVNLVDPDMEYRFGQPLRHYDIDDREELSIEEANLIAGWHGDAKIDIVISHTCPSSFYMGDCGNGNLVAGGENKGDMTRVALEVLRQRFQPKRWLFGHWHNSKKWMEGNCEAMLLDNVNKIRHGTGYMQTHRFWEVVVSEE